MSVIYKDGHWYGKGGGGSSITVDSSLSTTSENPVQNKVITTELNKKDEAVELTQSEYDSLTDAEKDSDTTYFITDALPTDQICYVGTKFNRSDIYKDTEQVIGSYLGKPLYQKVVSFPTIVTGENSILHNISDIEKVISWIGNAVRADGHKFSIPVIYLPTNAWSISISSVEPTKIWLQVGANFTGTYTLSAVDIVLQYTKTSDPANSAIYASEKDYSINETIIGTWVDGKPIYQKTIDFGALPNKTTKSVAHNIVNLDIVVDYFAIARRPSDNNIIKLPIINDSNINYQCSCAIVGTNIVMESRNIDFSAFVSNVTIQYTKTTD